MDNSPKSTLPVVSSSSIADTSRNMESQVSGHGDDSWLEVSSAPSSSSLSSGMEEIVTTGLRVQNSSVIPSGRKRRTRSRPEPLHHSKISKSSFRIINIASSGDQTEESESESSERRIISSKNDRNETDVHEQAIISEDDDINDVLRTKHIIGETHQNSFRPPPNAFSQPLPIVTENRALQTTVLTPVGQSLSSQPEEQNQTLSRRRPMLYRCSTTRRSLPARITSPTETHDALRASLSTLLSYAAAARGLTKSRLTQPSDINRRRTYSDNNHSNNNNGPLSFRLVSESAMNTIMNQPVSSPITASTNVTPMHAQQTAFDPCILPTIQQTSLTTSPYHSSSSRVQSSRDHHKRTPSQDQLSSPRHKKRRRSSSTSCLSVSSDLDPSIFETWLTPTILTWIVSVGVGVVLSAISFSAGYAIGREAGYAEASLALHSQSGFGGREAVWGFDGNSSMMGLGQSLDDVRGTASHAGNGLRKLRLGGVI